MTIKNPRPNQVPDDVKTCAVETCMDCLKPVEVVWHAPEDLWLQVIGEKDGTTLCVNCFDKRLLEKGIYKRWTCSEDL